MVIGIQNLLTYMQRKLQTLYCKGKFSLISAFFELEIFILDMFVLNFASQHCILYLYHAFSQCFQRKNHRFSEFIFKIIQPLKNSRFVYFFEELSQSSKHMPNFSGVCQNILRSLAKSTNFS